MNKLIIKTIGESGWKCDVPESEYTPDTILYKSVINGNGFIEIKITIREFHKIMINASHNLYRVAKMESEHKRC